MYIFYRTAWPSHSLLKPARAFEYSIDSLYKYIVYLIGGRKYQNWYLYLRGHQILDSTIPSPEPWLSVVQCLALLHLVRDQCASAEAAVAQPSCLSICCARPAQAAELLSVTKQP